ncbi:class I SAM-dependent methyltransferase [Chryseolinea lacunae]|uniref:Class I SAM-dependent methyltransferase n=1 Tax=Chryseolinea lacunae TaxID=2801331 RepID=A0ABS1KL45_9BACT|nr:class I SAM-dependent methyltransferase [Chryseolinea lacunae]MBL0740193.1 class I SAM-dependent methyltransferase [Chryseolinea lacunae]
MNEESHWNTIASNYNTEIFDVFKSDKNGVLPRYFDKHANLHHHAIDFGCGTGKAFPHLSPRFKNILALDISAECLGIARQRNHSNIVFKRADLTQRGVKLPEVEFVFCCNVIMLPERDKNVKMFQNISRALRPGGTAVVIVPSLDSVLLSSLRLIDWYKSEGVSVEDIPASDIDYFKNNKREFVQGIVHIDRVPTKHYTPAELELIMQQTDVRINMLEKVEYEWTTEFNEPPEWMKAPYPWDWLIELRKV